MAVKIVGVDELTAMLDRTADDTTREMAKVLQRGAEDVARLASEFSPRDSSALENAWEVVEMGGERDYRGRFTKKSYVVQVDPMATDPDGRPTSLYALEMHEHLAPYGSGRYQLSTHPGGSRDKDGGRGVVGGRFLERAVDEVEMDLMAQMQKVVRRNY